MSRLASLSRHAHAAFRHTSNRLKEGWRKFRSLRRRTQTLISIGVIALLVAAFALLGQTPVPESLRNTRTVTLKSVASLSGGGAMGSVFGTVTSISEAELLTKTGGTVRSVNARLGVDVGAGFAIAELENAAQRAAVLQAEGAYEAALAARDATSPLDVALAARNAYRGAFTDLDTTIENDIDDFFGAPTANGPDLLINPGTGDFDRLPRERVSIDRAMNQWRAILDQANTRDPELLLEEAEVVARQVSNFLTDLADAANRRGSGATSEQVTSLSNARTTVDALLAALVQARTTYRTGNTGATASADANVKIALGALRAAQASLEDTVVRAPISGTVNFLPIRVGDYVTALRHVATVAQNGALEVTAQVSEETRSLLAIGQKITIEGSVPGTITSIAPALDPITKQIEVRIAVDAGNAGTLTNGQSVQIALPAIRTSVLAASQTLPLTAVKLRARDRVVFTVGEDGRLIARPISIGAVRGASVEVTTPLPPELLIVSDARGLAEGESVTVAP